MLSADTRKRVRSIENSESLASAGIGAASRIMPTDATLLQQLVDRINILEPTWASAALRYQAASNMEAVLSAIGKDITASLKVVSASAELEKQRLKSLRVIAHSAIDDRFDELERNVSSAEVTKISALEREYVRIDDALEQIRREHAHAREAATTLDDAGLRHTTI